MTSRTYDLRAVLRMHDRMSGPMRRVAATWAGVSRRMRLPQIARGFGDVGRAVGGVTTRLQGLAGAMGLITGVASVAGLHAVTAGYAQAGDEIAKTADRLGIGVEALQELDYAAGRSGVASNTLHMAMQRLNRRMAEAAAGGNRNLAEMFEQLGISLRDVNGNVRTAEDVLPELAEAFRQNENASVRTRMAFAAFDSEGVQMVQMLSGGAVALQELRDEARQLGRVLSEEEAGNAEAYTDALSNFQFAATGVRNAIGAQLLPILQPLLENLTQWIANNRELIAQRVAQAITAIARAIEAFDWQAFGETVRGIGRAIGWVVDFFGGWENAALALAAVLSANLLASLAGVVVAIGRLGMLLYANPITLAVIGIATAIGGAVYLIYKHWDAVGPWFERLFGGIVEVLRGFAGLASGILTGDIGRVVDGLRSTLGGVGKVWQTVVDGIMGILTGLIRWLDTTFDTGIGEWISGVLEALQPLIDAFEVVRNAIDAMDANVETTMGHLGDADYLVPSADSDSPFAHGFEPDPLGRMVHPSTGQTWQEFQSERSALPVRGQSLIQNAAAAGIGGTSPSEVTVHVEIANAPAGTRVVADSQDGVPLTTRTRTSMVGGMF